MTATKNTNPRRKAKFAEHPQIAIQNKIRRLTKYIRKNPNDNQAKQALKELK